MTTIKNKFAQLGTSIINLVGTRASKNMDNLTSTGEANIVEIIENAGISGKGSGHSIGEIVYSAIPISDACFHLLDGGLIYGDGIYNDFVTYMSTLYAADPTANYWTTETDWQSSVTTYGVCGKFVYDSTNNTVRLPKITGKLEGTTDVNALGELIEQFVRLPNIQGRMTSSGWRLGDATPTGPFYRENTGGDRPQYSTSGGSEWYFDASRCSDIYSGNGTDTKIHEQAVKMFVYIVIATSAKTDIQVDIDNVTTQINSMVSKSDLQEVQCIVETYVNGTSWYRVWSDGWCEQGGTVTQNASSLTVTFLKTFSNTDYALNVYKRANDNDTGGYDATHCEVNGGSPYDYGQSTTGFRCSTASGSAKFTWQANGYIEV